MIRASRIADETESALMRIETMNEVINEQYEQENKDFLELLDWYGGNLNEQKIHDMVLGVYSFIQSSPWPEKWLEEKIEAMKISDDADFAETIWGREILKSCRMELDNAKNMLQRAISLLCSAEGLERYIPVFEEDLANVQRLLDMVSETGKHKNQAHPGMTCMSSQRIFISKASWRAGKNADKKLQKTVKDIRDAVKKVIVEKIGKTHN